MVVRAITAAPVVPAVPAAVAAPAAPAARAATVAPQAQVGREQGSAEDGHRAVAGPVVDSRLDAVGRLHRADRVALPAEVSVVAAAALPEVASAAAAAAVPQVPVAVAVGRRHVVVSEAVAGVHNARSRGVAVAT